MCLFLKIHHLNWIGWRFHFYFSHFHRSIGERGIINKIFSFFLAVGICSNALSCDNIRFWWLGAIEKFKCEKWKWNKIVKIIQSRTISPPNVCVCVAKVKKKKKRKNICVAKNMHIWSKKFLWWIFSCKRLSGNKRIYLQFFFSTFLLVFMYTLVSFLIVFSYWNPEMYKIQWNTDKMKKKMFSDWFRFDAVERHHFNK